MPSPSSRSVRCRICAPAVAILLAAGTVTAEEVEVRNDSFESGGPAVIVGDFIPGEQAGVRLTAPCDGEIVAVQIGWLSGKPQKPTIEEAIHIYAGTTFPIPGVELEVLSGPVMQPGFLNEFRYLDKGQTIPLSIPVSEGDQFYVTIEFANPTDVGNGGASVFRDVNGCQSGRNVLFALPGGWLNFCIFLQGDLVIRAVIDCFEGPGACCFNNGTCLNLERDVCEDANGTFEGPNSTCAMTECAAAEEACCFETTGCLDIPPTDCMNAGGVPQGPSTECNTTVCFPTGACCLTDGTCLDEQSPEDCAAQTGEFQGNLSTCEFVDCPAPAGGCCFPNDFCLELEEDDCVMVGAAWGGPGTTCADIDENGTPDVCEDGCPEDVNGNGIAEFGDILAILAAWGPCKGCPEDVNGDGIAGFADVLAVLAQWGACP